MRLLKCYTTSNKKWPGKVHFEFGSQIEMKFLIVISNQIADG